MTKSIQILLLLAACCMSLFSWADSPAPKVTWTKTVGKNDEFLFVMLNSHCKNDLKKRDELLAKPCDQSEQSCQYFQKYYATKQEELKICKQYPTSGLYKKGQYESSLWSISEYSHSADLSSDGHYLVQPGPWASSVAETAVSFYKNGKLLKQYKIQELIENESSLLHSVSHFIWEQDWTFDDANHTLTIRTVDDGTFRFDIHTGKILSAQRGGKYFWRATVTTKSNQKMQLTHFCSCGNELQDILGGNSCGIVMAENEDIFAVGYIKEVHFLTDKPSLMWQIKTVDGEELKVNVENQVEYCGKDMKGKEVILHTTDIKSLVFTELFDKPVNIKMPLPTKAK